MSYLVTFAGGAKTPWLGLQSKYLIPDTDPSFFPTAWSSSIPSHILNKRTEVENQESNHALYQTPEENETSGLHGTVRPRSHRFNIIR